MDAETFITQWQGVKAFELSTSQSFLIDLCELLGVEKPHPTPEQAEMPAERIEDEVADGARWSA